ncbi:hypothetical protein ACIBLA_06910 [Streptomyces sp. NPDC050433]|uniref:hypothetical protein n=1 Tax=Streptomyces sp. NPDC050433 TaxID=3365615 RepID=UPI003789D224
MRIYRTTPTRSFSTFTNELLRDRRISWCAAGVLVYLLSLPPNGRASIRSLTEQRKEGRARIMGALHDLERCGYLRRVLVRNPDSGELSTVYEVFDRPYTDRVTGEPAASAPENGQNPACPSPNSCAPPWSCCSPSVAAAPDSRSARPRRYGWRPWPARR